MTRLLILGSSHVAALKMAAPAFAQRFPQIDLSFFASPAPTFRVGRVNDRGVFSPNCSSQQDIDFVQTVNGAQEVDLTAHDHVLISGFRFNLGHAAALLMQHDILEGTDTGRPRVCSQAFVRACIDASIEDEVALVTQCLGDNRNYTLTDAPYPAETITARSADYAPARVLGHFMHHPDAQGMFDYWKQRVAQRVTGLGYGWMPQPADTVAKPFATSGPYAAAAPHLTGDKMGWVDHRHMNADFGLRMLETFATEHLNLVPKAA